LPADIFSTMAEMGEQHAVEARGEQLLDLGVERLAVAVDRQRDGELQPHRIERGAHRRLVGGGRVLQVHVAHPLHVEFLDVRDHAAVLLRIARAHVVGHRQLVAADAHVAAGRAQHDDLRLLDHRQHCLGGRAAGEPDQRDHALVDQRLDVGLAAVLHAAVVERDQLEARPFRVGLGSGRERGGDAVAHILAVAGLTTGKGSRLAELDDGLLLCQDGGAEAGGDEPRAPENEVSTIHISLPDSARSGRAEALTPVVPAALSSLNRPVPTAGCSVHLHSCAGP
jgi:hypothetical protein